MMLVICLNNQTDNCQFTSAPLELSWSDLSDGLILQDYYRRIFVVVMLVNIMVGNVFRILVFRVIFKAIDLMPINLIIFLDEV